MQTVEIYYRQYQGFSLTIIDLRAEIRRGRASKLEMLALVSMDQ